MPNSIIPYNPALKRLARQLRKAATPGELALWKRIRSKQLGIEFHRQVPVDDYIIDFYCHELRFAIEIDGGSHNDAKAKGDAERQQKLESLGLRFIRFTEREAHHKTDVVVMIIVGLIGTMH